MDLEKKKAAWISQGATWMQMVVQEGLLERDGASPGWTGLKEQGLVRHLGACNRRPSPPFGLRWEGRE